MWPNSRTLTLHTQGNIPYISFPALDALPFVRHGFSTRLGGVSTGIYQSMNLSFTRGDSALAVHENFRRFAHAVGISPDTIVVSAQTHLTEVRRVGADDRGRGVFRERGYTDVDGLITNEPRVALCTQYADCVPLFFADPVRRAIGTSHAGWKGTAAGIATATVRRMAEEFGSRPEDLLVAIGPSIGPCCFEVDTPVYTVFASLPCADESCFFLQENGKYRVNLWEINRRLLMGAGVLPEHITVTDLCTRCHPDLFWSHRAAGNERGSLAGLIALA